MRRWRGEIDVPLTLEGLDAAVRLGEKLNGAGGLSVVFHDWLSRCRDTAQCMSGNRIESRGPRPWRMGHQFEGHPITPESLRWAQWFAENPTVVPEGGGEAFLTWYRQWMNWLAFVESDYELDRIGVVTHNRNIQAVYSTTAEGFQPELYNCDGPDFCTVHYYRNGKLTPWDEQDLRSGVYLIRHGETSFGT